MRQKSRIITLRTYTGDIRPYLQKDGQPGRLSIAWERFPRKFTRQNNFYLVAYTRIKEGTQPVTRFRDNAPTAIRWIHQEFVAIAEAFYQAIRRLLRYQTHRQDRVEKKIR
jgi:hypothetical protein